MTNEFKVLSIDFDYIMAPCIKLYNDMSQGDENPSVIWNIIEHERGIEPFLQYDASSLMDIAKIIKSNIKNGARLVPIKEHQEIVDWLKANDTHGPIDLTNIDFHHDVFYGGDLSLVTEMDQYNCGNWVYYLHTHNMLSAYTWVKAPQSDMLREDIDFKISKILRKSDLKTIPFNFNVVFFCLSPQWVPYKFHHLYDLILELCKEDNNERTLCSE